MSPSPDVRQTGPLRISNRPVRSPSPIVSTAVPSAAAEERSAAECDSIQQQLQRTRQQLEEVQRLYSYEKRAHLQQRARQLRDEAQQCQTEENVVAQVAQLLTEYEELIKFRDVACAEHLEAVMQRVSREWQRSAATLEATREECAASLLSRLQASCAAQQEALKNAMQEHLTTTAQKEVAAETRQFQTIATAVQDQVESFKFEYRAIIEQDFEERRRLMDAQTARREQQWLQFLKEEHARMIAAGETAARESTQRQLETLHAAMRDITELRERLVKEHAQRQADVGRAYVDAYEGLAEEYAAASLETASFAQQLQQEYAAVIQQLHREIRRATDAKQAAEEQARQMEVHMQEAIAVQQHDLEARVAARWEAKLQKERDSYRAALAQLARKHEDALHDLQASCTEKEVARVAQYEAELFSLQTQLTSQREQHAAQAEAAYGELTDALRHLEEEKAALLKEVSQLKEERRTAECAHAAAVQRLRSEQAEYFAAQLRDLDERYDAALKLHKERTNAGAPTSACSGGNDGDSSVVAAAHALQRVAQLEKELHDVQRQHTEDRQHAVDESTALWSAKLKDAQQRLMEERDALEVQHRRLRQSLLTEVREREEAVEARCAVQRQAHEKEMQDALLAEKASAQRVIDRLQREHEDDIKQREADAATHVRLREEALTVRERALSEAKAAWEQRRADEQQEALQALLRRAAAEGAQLQEAQEAFAAQQLERADEMRTAVQAEAKAKFDAQLRDAQQRWMQLLEADAAQRYEAWTKARKAELEAVHILHAQEVSLLRASYEKELERLRHHHVRHIEDFKEEMQAREKAWGDARAASLTAYEKAAADRLSAVLAQEKATWETMHQQQHQHQQETALDSVAQRAVQVLAATEEDRCRMENELRDVYVAVINDQEAKTAQYLTELHTKHEHELAALRQDHTTRLQQQARELQELFATRVQQHETRLQKVLTSHAEEMSALRKENAQRLAEQRAAAQEALQQAQQQAMEAQRALDVAMRDAQREVAQAHQRQVDDLQKQIEAQAAQLLRCEADTRVQVQRAREEQQAALRDEYERSMASLREALDARNQSYATLQTSLYDQVHAEVACVQAKMEKAYVTFTQEQQKDVAERLAAQAAAQVAQQGRLQEQLACLSQQHEVALASQAAKLRIDHDNACAALTAVFEKQQEEWKRLLEVEQVARRTAEDEVRNLKAQTAQLEVTQTQQQATAYRALDQKYQHVLEQALVRLQAEREALAQRSLEEAEQRFVSEMLQGASVNTFDDHDSAPTPAAVPAFANRAHELPAVLTGMISAPSPYHVSLAAESLPQHARNGVVTPAASRTPCPAASPLPLSPAGPVELVEHAEPGISSSSATTTASLSPSATSPVSMQQREQQQEKMDLQRLQQLWDVLEVPPDDRHAFLDFIDTFPNGTPQRRQVWEGELQRLESQLPLLEALTRRDYVARQLRTLRKTTPPLSARTVNEAADLKSASCGGKGDPIERLGDDSVGGKDTTKRVAASGSRDGGVPPELSQVYDRLVGELATLTAELRRDVTAHEAQYGQLFCYNGQRVMETLNQ